MVFSIGVLKDTRASKMAEARHSIVPDVAWRGRNTMMTCCHEEYVRVLEEEKKLTVYSGWNAQREIAQCRRCMQSVSGAVGVARMRWSSAPQ